MKTIIRFLDSRWIMPVVFVVLIALGLILDPERSWGGIAWTFLSGYAMYFFGLQLAAPHLLPISPDPQSRRLARRLLVRFAGSRKPMMAIVREGKVLPGPDKQSREKAGGDGAIFVDSTSAVALVTDTGLSRIVGPGVHFTRQNERIGKVIDLRIQAKGKDVEAQTRDGIRVKFKINIRFRIAGIESRKVLEVDRKIEKWPAPYTWNKRAVSLIARALSQERAGLDQIFAWDELPLNEAIKRAHEYVAQYTYDGLTEPRNPQANPRQDIQRRLEDDVRKALADSGIKVLRVRLSQFTPADEAIDKQRLEAWKADWIRRQKIIEAEGRTESYRLVEMARAQGQMELVLRIGRALEVSQQVGVENADLIALRLLEVVEQLAAEPGLREFLGEEPREALDQVQRKLLREGTPGGASSAP